MNPKHKLPTIASLFILFCVVVSGVVYAEGQRYQPGLQHIYPYYNPGFATSSNESLTNYLDMNLSSNLTSAQKVDYFAQNYLAVNELGGIALGTALYSVSNLNPEFNDLATSQCGLAGWECNGDRWQELQAFSDYYNLDYLSLEAQLVFINKELNGLKLKLDQEIEGSYVNVYEALADGDNLEEMLEVLASQYLNLDEQKDLAAIARNHFNYDPNREYNTDVLEPQYILPQFNPNDPSFSDCTSGRAIGYVERLTDSDHNGSILAYSEAGKSYVHRCILDISNRIVNDFNQTRSNSSHYLKFWGWRSHQRQIELRTENGCPDIYESPSDKCTTPTARPGSSNHQDGLALDFYCSSGTVSKSNCGGAYNWLKCYAADYGFINLKTATIDEPWHWDHFTAVPSTSSRKLAKTC